MFSLITKITTQSRQLVIVRITQGRIAAILGIHSGLFQQQRITGSNGLGLCQLITGITDIVNGLNREIASHHLVGHPDLVFIDL